MPCPQDPDLMELGVLVDKFKVPKAMGISSHPPTAFMLTHAHQDHMKGLKANFGERRRHAKIYCTQVTADLAMLAVHGLEKRDFAIVSYGEPFHPAPHVTAWAFPAFHCDGSAMFLFELYGDDDAKGASAESKHQVLRILYTGDFRFHPDMRKNDLLVDHMVDRLYYDDLFDEISVEYPNYAETVQTLVAAISMLQDRGYRHLYINASILGIEPVLREVVDLTGYQLSLSPSLRKTWRGKQLKYLLGNRLDENHATSITLGHRAKDDDRRSPWIIPTCTYFLCSTEEEKANMIEERQSHHFYVWFCTHSNQHENNHFKAMVSARHVNPCQEALSSRDDKTLACHAGKPTEPVQKAENEEG